MCRFINPIAMPQFPTIEKAFEWFLENIYPELPAEQKTVALRSAKHAFYSEGRSISQKRMKRILEENSDYENVHQINKGE